MSCINPDIGNKLFLWEMKLLSEKQAREFEQHVFECEKCARDISTGLDNSFILREYRKESVKINELLEESQKSLDKGNIKTARNYCFRALQIDPENTNVLKEIGFLYNMEKNWKRALEYMHRAIESSEENSVAYFHLGQVKVGMGEDEKAMKWFKKAAELDPEIADSLVELAFKFEKAKKTILAKKLLELSLTLDPNNGNAR